MINRYNDTEMEQEILIINPRLSPPRKRLPRRKRNFQENGLDKCRQQRIDKLIKRKKRIINETTRSYQRDQQQQIQVKIYIYFFI